MKRIELNNEKKNELASIFSVSRVTIWSALTYNSDSDKARRIRKAAIAKGGKIVHYDDHFIPNCRCELDRLEDGSISNVRLSFPGDVELMIYEDRAEVCREGDTIATRFGATLRTIPALAMMAQGLSEDCLS